MTRTITPTHVLLSQITLAANATDVTFSSLPATYGDLVLVASARSTTAGSGEDSLDIRFNSDTGSNYNMVRMYGTGSSAISATNTSVTSMPIGRIGYASYNFAPNIIQIMDYSATDKHKTVLGRANVAEAVVYATAGRWASTNAITSIAISLGSGNIVSGSTFALYGVHA